jgi:Flp pilus assembly protein TadG
VFAIAVVFLTALIVDGGVALNARARATDIAGQAARAAADDIDIVTLRTSGKIVIAPDACTDASNLVSAYALHDSGGVDRVTSAIMQGCDAAGDAATVQVTITTRPLVPGLGSFTETASQTATAECGITQGEVC